MIALRLVNVQGRGNRAAGNCWSMRKAEQELLAGKAALPR
jgi:hypothetical protein